MRFLRLPVELLRLPTWLVRSTAARARRRAGCPLHGAGPCEPSPWQFEADMLSPVLAQQQVFLRADRVVALTEVPAPQGVADLVLVEFDRKAQAGRAAAGAVPLPDMTTVRAVIAMSAGAPADEVARAAGVTRRTLADRVLPRAAVAGWAERAAGVWRLTLPYEVPVTRMATVELKREKWRAALAQASRHERAADASWVVVDETRAGAPGRAADAFRMAGVGLASVGRFPDGCARGGRAVRVIVPAVPVSAPDPSARAWLAEQCASRSLAGVLVGTEQPVFGRLLSQVRESAQPLEP